MLLYYVRHGDPTYDPDSLTPLGREQARAVAKRLIRYGLDEIYASSSERAKQTAQPTCDLLKKQMIVCEWANESVAWKYFSKKKADGGVSWACFQPDVLQDFHSPEVRALGNEWYKHPCFKAEGYGNLEEGVGVIDRSVDEFLLSLGYKHDRAAGRYLALEKNEKRVALFAHQGMGMCFLSSLLDIPYPMISSHFDMGHSGVTVVHFNENDEIVYPKVLQLSNDSHLYREELLTGYQNKLYI